MAWKNSWDLEIRKRSRTSRPLKIEKKSSGDLRRLAVSQTPVKANQQTLVLKTHKYHNDNDLEIIGHPNYYIIEIGRNTEKSPGDLRRLAVTQTPVNDHQLTLI